MINDPGEPDTPEPGSRLLVADSFVQLDAMIYKVYKDVSRDLTVIFLGALKDGFKLMPTLVKTTTH